MSRKTLYRYASNYIILYRFCTPPQIAGGVEREQEDATEEHKHRLVPASSRVLPRLYLWIFAPPGQIPLQ